MKLKDIVESRGGNLYTQFHYSGQKGKTTNLLLKRVDDAVSKKAPVAGKKLLDRVRSFKVWANENS